MKITLTLKTNQKNEDFQLNNEIQIKEAIDIIMRNSEFNIDTNIQYIYSKRKQKKISVNYTFEQANIFSGDEIIVEEIE